MNPGYNLDDNREHLLTTVTMTGEDLFITLTTTGEDLLTTCGDDNDDHCDDKVLWLY